MNQMATITSKNQLTLPMALFKRAGFRIGQKVIVSEENGRLILTPAEKLVEELAGSVPIPKKWQGKSIPFIKEQAIKDYFRHYNIREHL